MIDINNLTEGQLNIINRLSNDQDFCKVVEKLNNNEEFCNISKKISKFNDKGIKCMTKILSDKIILQNAIKFSNYGKPTIKGINHLLSFDEKNIEYINNVVERFETPNKYIASYKKYYGDFATFDSKKEWLDFLNEQNYEWFENKEVNKIKDQLFKTKPLSSTQETYVDDNKSGVIKLYLPKYKKDFNVDLDQLLDTCDIFSNQSISELVDKNKSQKFIMEVSNNKDEVELFLKTFLMVTERTSDIVITEIENSYEFILKDLVVHNSEERLRFVNEFRNYLNKNKMNSLSGEIKNTLNDVRDYPNHEQWKSIGSIKNEKNLEDRLATILDSSKGIYIYNIIIDSNINSYNTNSYNTKLNVKNDYDFVDYIKNERPEWYVPNIWINIDDFYNEYSKFGLTKKRNYFAKSFQDILWKKKRRTCKNGSLEYKLLDI